MDTELLSDTFVDLADTMVADFDVIDFLHMLTDRSVQLLSVAAAGVLLADPRGRLRVAAASSEAAQLVELFQIQDDQGPCLDCCRTGQPVTVADLAGPGGRRGLAGHGPPSGPGSRLSRRRRATMSPATSASRRS